MRRPLSIAAGLALLVFGCDRLLPPPLPAAGDLDATLVLARDGTPLRAFAAADGVWRYPIAPESVSPRYLEALLGYEDRRFYQHPGVDPIAIARAAAQALAHARVVSGGSTLTMQVARLIEPMPRSFGGKLKQIVRALQIELRLEKREILALYLARAPFGGNLEGVEAASWAYLGKSSRQLSHAEAALLAVLPQAPSRLRPDRNPAAARTARDKVLARLAARGTWPASIVAEAALEPVSARRLAPPLAAALLAERLRAQAPGEGVIRTTIDAGLQRGVERAVAAHLASLPERTSAAILVVENRALEARAYVGSARFADPARLGHVDMVTAARSPGSTLKPLLYGLALDDGLIHSESLLIDAPQDFDGYRPANFEQAFSGPVAASDALRRSLNVPAVDLLERVTPARFAARLAHAGVVLELPAGAAPNLALVLGGAATRLEALVGAYAALARAGIAGRVRYRSDAPLAERRLLSEGAAWIVRSMLADAGRPGENIVGLDRSRRTEIAYKTGTSYGFRDAWAIGVTARYTVGVWIGRPDGTPMPGYYGAITALPLLFTLIDGLPRAASDAGASAPPTTVQSEEICWPSGRARALTDPHLCHELRRAWTIEGHVPPSFAARDDDAADGLEYQVLVDATSGRRVVPACATSATRSEPRVRWPRMLEPWLTPAQRIAAAPPPWAPGCEPDAVPQARGLRIAGAIAGSIVRRAPGADAPVLALRALGAQGRVEWLLNERWIGASEGAEPLRHRFAHAGEQRLLAIDRGGGYDRVVLRVEK
jgi:penicillin-binding protein 1C